MLTWIVLSLCSVLLAVLVGWALPAWAAKRIAREIEADDASLDGAGGGASSPALGLVWLVWAVGVAVASSLVALLLLKLDAGSLLLGIEQQMWRASLDYTPFVSVITVVPLLLVLGAFAFGLAQDAYGRGGTVLLTTLGVGALAFVTSGQIANAIGRIDPLVRDAAGWSQGAYLLFAWVAAAVVIALSAVLLRRVDTRPGRALATYLPMALIGAGLSAWGYWQVMERNMIQSVVNVSVGGAENAIPGLPEGDQVWVWFAGVIVCILVLVLGPVLAAWRHDRGGRARLGSAGSLAMGAVGGYLLARSAPLWLLGGFALVLIGLNLAIRSARVTPAPESTVDGAWTEADDGAWAGGPTAEGDDARRDDVS